MNALANVFRHQGALFLAEGELLRAESRFAGAEGTALDPARIGALKVHINFGV